MNGSMEEERVRSPGRDTTSVIEFARWSSTRNRYRTPLLCYVSQLWVGQPQQHEQGTREQACAVWFSNVQAKVEPEHVRTHVRVDLLPPMNRAYMVLVQTYNQLNETVKADIGSVEVFDESQVGAKEINITPVAVYISWRRLPLCLTWSCTTIDSKVRERKG